MSSESAWVEAFAKLRIPKSKKGNQLVFEVVSSPKRPWLFLGKSAEGRPAFLVEISEIGPTSPIVKLGSVVMYPSLQCRIKQGSKIGPERIYAVVSFVGNDASLTEHFITAVGAVLSALGRKPSRLEITAALNKLVDLFRLASLEPRKTVQGLFGELLVIATSRKPERLVECWHSEPDETFDFRDGLDRLEIKTSSTGFRAHSFSWEQLKGIDQGSCVVGSLLVDRRENGTPLRDLVARIRKKLLRHPEQLSKFEYNLTACLGRALTESFEACFDEGGALKSISYFESKDIPQPSGPLPKGVSEMRFKSDLTLVKPLSPKALCKLGTMYAFLKAH